MMKRKSDQISSCDDGDCGDCGDDHHPRHREAASQVQEDFIFQKKFPDVVAVGSRKNEVGDAASEFTSSVFSTSSASKTEIDRACTQRGIVQQSKEKPAFWSRLNRDIAQHASRMENNKISNAPSSTRPVVDTAEQKFDQERKRLWNELDQQLKEKGLEEALNDPDVAVTYNNIAVHLLDEGEFDEAMDLFEKRLEIEKKFFRRDDYPTMASTYHNIGIVLVNQGKYEEAMEQYQRSLEIKLEALEPNHPEIAATHHEIGNVLHRQGKYEEAMEQYQRSLEIKLKAYGPDHPKIAETYHQIGNVLHRQGKYEEAMEQYQRSLAIK
ncbi:unnamed protein product [Cylindrotheca closterium]|uniref:Kinesin light chain n=1 Tax=Cylindrotheca closterium TaxID=2856 RepID=A0AAD2CVM4_9STRA|nr:unnamed protein product [Cylindrotheca closterium]